MSSPPMVVVGGVCLQAGAAPASTPMVVVEGASLEAATAPASTPADATVNVEERRAPLDDEQLEGLFTQAMMQGPRGGQP